MTKIGAKRFARAIDDDYRVHWIVDNLPASRYSRIRWTRRGRIMSEAFLLGLGRRTSRARPNIFCSITSICFCAIEAVEFMTEEDEFGSLVSGSSPTPSSTSMMRTLISM